ncbi:MAG TPA: hypothetical protein VF075_13195 [Pyrinomonadaceae bacterium]
MNKVCFALVAVLLCLGVAARSRAFNDAQLQAGSLCQRDEKVVFSCTVTKAAKIVSLCSSKQLTKEQGYLQYRFGLPDKVELEYPKQRGRPQDAFKYSHYFRAQVDLTELSFSSNGYEYSIVDDYNGEQKPAQHSQGITITPPNSDKQVVLNCRGRAQAQYADLTDVFPAQN